MKKLHATLSIATISLILVLGSALLVFPAIQQLAGLAVAQSATTWKGVRDAFVGDSLADGIMAQSPYLWNGSSFDRQRGSIANGALVDVSRMPGSSTTPADSFANPTNAQTTWSLPGVFNGTTWDRRRGLGGLESVVPSQSRTLTITQQSVSAANTAVSITITNGFAGLLTQLNGLDAYCSAGTANITITRTTGPTTIWSTPTTAVGTALFSKEWPVPLTSSVASDNITVTLSACGAANTGTLMVRGGVGI